MYFLSLTHAFGDLELLSEKGTLEGSEPLNLNHSNSVVLHTARINGSE